MCHSMVEVGGEHRAAKGNVGPPSCCLPLPICLVADATHSFPPQWRVQPLLHRRCHAPHDWGGQQWPDVPPSSSLLLQMPPRWHGSFLMTPSAYNCPFPWSYSLTVDDQATSSSPLRWMRPWICQVDPTMCQCNADDDDDRSRGIIPCGWGGGVQPRHPMAEWKERGGRKCGGDCIEVSWWLLPHLSCALSLIARHHCQWPWCHSHHHDGCFGHHRSFSSYCHPSI